MPSLYGGITMPGRPDPFNIAKLDRLIIPQINRMQQHGVAIDVERLRDVGSDCGTQLIELRKDILNFIPPDKLHLFEPKEEEEKDEKDNQLELPGVDLDSINLNSPLQVAIMLFEVFGIGAGTKLKITKSGKISTGKKQLEGLKLLKPCHPVIPKLLKYREVHKIKTTYIDKFPTIARVHNRGECWCGRKHYEQHYRIHTQILSTRTDTGRLASKNPNLQNLPARTALGKLVRSCFIAQPGFKLVDRDYSQFELRWLAHFSKDPNMLRIFWQGLDIHLDTAMRAFGITDPKLVDKDTQRNPCKNVNFGVAYGLGPEGLLDLMILTYATANKDVPDWLDLDWCAKFLELWFNLYPQAKEYFDKLHYLAQRYRFVWSTFGRVRNIPEVMSCHAKVVAAGLRQAGNMPIQGSQADAMKLGMARVEDCFQMMRAMGEDVEVLLPVHDELLCEAEEENAENTDHIMQEAMDRCLCYSENVDIEMGDGDMLGAMGDFLVPIKTEGKVMDRWEK